jgi:type IV pilus assembly protein PilA
MKNMQKGFTLIELMIVVAIIAILAAIAIPAYQDYITRSQFSEAVTVADGLKTPMQDYVGQTGACAKNGDATSGILAVGSYLGKYVAGATTGGAATTNGSGCTITVTFKQTAGSVSAPLKTASVQFTSTNNGGTYTWACKETTGLADKYKPQVCR